jgi:hypothetical protein
MIPAREKAPGLVLPQSEYGVLRRWVWAAGELSGSGDVQGDELKIRYESYPKLVQINVPESTGDFSMLSSNNAHTRGTCFGDSGGPNLLGSGATETKVVAGVTSYGKNGNCAGTGGVFRMDRQDVLDFVRGYLR